VTIYARATHSDTSHEVQEEEHIPGAKSVATDVRVSCAAEKIATGSLAAIAAACARPAGDATNTAEACKGNQSHAERGCGNDSNGQILCSFRPVLHIFR